MAETIKINSLPTLTTLLKVAAYARVSNGKDAMLHSLSEQVSYYNRYIQEHDGWQFAGIYADEAISGTKENRDEFQRMLMDAYEGKIDLIITKSISRFARNTMTLLETIKKLKKHNVNVFFEEQNLYSMSGECEMILTMLASFAQEEARSVSENMKWKIRKDFEEGLLWGGNNAYGYRIENRRYVIVPEEASLVKHIFNLYLEGLGITAIALKLNKMNIPAYFGGKWNFSSVQNILKNQIYTGDLILQKTFRTDYISKKRKINRGEKDKFLISNDHESIISRSDFNKVQEMIKSKSKRYNVPDNCYSHRYPFSGMIECSECHKTYIHRKKHGIDKWGCQSAEQYGRAYCKTSDAISNSILEEVTAKVLNLDKFDEKIFKSEILKIISKPNHLLTFIFKDGSERDITWSNPSRSKSWTPEMKEVARQRSLNLNKKRGEDGRWLKEK